MLPAKGAKETAVARRKNPKPTNEGTPRQSEAAGAPAFRTNAMEGALRALKAELSAKEDREAAEKRERALKARADAERRARGEEQVGGVALDDRALLRRAYGGVARMGDKKLAPKPEGPRRAPIQRAPVDPETARAKDDMSALLGGGVRFRADVDEDGRVSAYRTDHGPHLLKQLRAAAPDARVDLHGHTAEAAERALVEFIRTAFRAKKRAVIVIHGKGLHSEGGAGVLGGLAAETLLKGRAAPWVLAVETAPENRGGLGALVVLLAKA